MIVKIIKHNTNNWYKLHSKFEVEESKYNPNCYIVTNGKDLGSVIFQSDCEVIIEKPPLGLIPKHVHQEIRLNNIKEAIQRYMETNKTIDIRWVEEYNELIK
jgi:hypothetical protein